MKKRIFALTGILLALLLVLAGCGSRAANDSPGDAGYGSYNQKSESYKASETLFDTENPMPSPGEPATGENSGAALTTDRKLIQTAWMELESRDCPGPGGPGADGNRLRRVHREPERAGRQPIQQPL